MYRERERDRRMREQKRKAVNVVVVRASFLAGTGLRVGEPILDQSLVLFLFLFVVSEHG
jgi:hypothetical protein